MAINIFISLLRRLKVELGLDSILNSSRDTKLLCLQRFVRLFAYGASTLILALYLSSLGISDARIGLFMTLTLMGDVVISFGLTLFADGLGRRKTLVAGSALMSASGAIFAFNGNYWVLVAASIFGVISPRYVLSCFNASLEFSVVWHVVCASGSLSASGNEIGPFKAIEESTIAQLTPSSIRSDIFAWYTLLGTAGSACGIIISGWIVEGLKKVDGFPEIRAYRMIFGIYTLLGILKLVLSLMLSDACEPQPEKEERHADVELDTVEAEGLLSDSESDTAKDSNPKPNTTPASRKKSIWPSISPSSRGILIKLCLLFAVDSFASGLVPQSWITYFFTRKFALPEGQLGTLFFVTNIISSISNLVASSISKRIGLIKTMVFTHLPSAFFLALIPLPNNVIIATAFLFLRSSMSSMDQAPRQAFLAAAVLPSERTAVMGVVNVVRTLSQSGGPVVTGGLAGAGKFWVSFLIAGLLKMGYDLAMLKMFLGYKPREEQNNERGPTQPGEPRRTNGEA
ncbi:hypothetical protein MMC22_007859 [Lobaria immixta]|nr:hypothetical protein [Lobaria immixta]